MPVCSGECYGITSMAVPIQTPLTTVPPVTGQCAEVLSLIRQHQPLLSFVLTADHAIPEAAARVHDLRSRGFHIITRIVPQVWFRGRARRNAALYSLGVPEWPAPGFLTDERSPTESLGLYS
jgi:Helix-turn-helix domain